MIVVPDTNVWLMWSGKPGWEKSFPAGVGQPSVLVATIVLQELLAGARDTAEREYLTALFRLARRYRKVINPPAAAWVLSGATVLTYNRADFTLVRSVLPVEFLAPESAG